MKAFDYLVIGAGMVSDSAVRAIRERDSDGSIGILGDDPTRPFPRPPLSKDLWTDDDATIADMEFDTADDTGAEILLGRRVVAVDTEIKRVSTQTGETFGYERLLIATGGHPRRLETLEESERVVYFRTLSDYERLRGLVEGGSDVAVVGGGFIGTEMAAALHAAGCAVTILHEDDVLGGAVFPPSLARRVEGLFTDAGVTVRGGVQVESGATHDDGVSLRLSDGSTLEYDVVVLGLGIEPAGDVGAATVERAEDGGVVVDERLRTTADDVWAAGDVAHYPDAILGRRRVEHEDNALSMGKVVGANMAGADEVYDHTPMFYSDLFDHG